MHGTWMSQCWSGWGQALVFHPPCAGVLQLSAVGWDHPSTLLTRLWWPFPGKHSGLDTVQSICMRKKHFMVLLTKVDPWAGWGMARGKLQGHRGVLVLLSGSEWCPAVGEMHWAVLLPWALVHWVPSGFLSPVPGGAWGSTLVFDVGALVFFSLSVKFY